MSPCKECNCDEAVVIGLCRRCYRRAWKMKHNRSPAGAKPGRPPLRDVKGILVMLAESSGMELIELLMYIDHLRSNARRLDTDNKHGILQYQTE